MVRVEAMTENRDKQGMERKGRKGHGIRPKCANTAHVRCTKTGV